MGKLVEIIGNALQKYGLFPAVSIMALIIGGYGCWIAKNNENQLHHLAIEQARTDSKVDTTTKDLLDNLQRVDKTLIELTTQIKLLVDGKLVVGVK